MALDAFCGLGGSSKIRRRIGVRALATALRLSEDKFSMAFEGNADAIFVSEIASGRFLEVNIGFARLTGRTRQEAILR